MDRRVGVFPSRQLWRYTNYIYTSSSRSGDYLELIEYFSAPDLSVIARINNLTWSMTSDFYVLLRGVLERNFGDPLIPIPETIPIEILQKPITGCVSFTWLCSIVVEMRRIFTSFLRGMSSLGSWFRF